MDKKPKPTPLSAKLGRDVFFNTSPDLPRILEVDLTKLRPNPDQPRQNIDPPSLQELATSIEQHGLIQPIAVARDPENPEGFIVVAGERRVQAFQLLGRETIPAIMTTGAPDEIALIENIQRESLHPLEEAEAFAKLMAKHHYTHEEVSKVIGKARNTVTELLSLNALPESLKQECRMSDIPKSILIELCRVSDPEVQLNLWNELKHGKLTVKQLREKKKARPERELPAPHQKALRAGKGFLRQLEDLAAQEDGIAAAWLPEFRILRRKINNLIDALTMKQDASEAGEGSGA
jgi:ParB family transcriptional regulator, chromosome partitioning protein